MDASEELSSSGILLEDESEQSSENDSSEAHGRASAWQHFTLDKLAKNYKCKLCGKSSRTFTYTTKWPIVSSAEKHLKVFPAFFSSELCYF